MADPDARHARLIALAGRWRGPERMEPSRWVPEGAVAEATVVMRPGPGGFTLVEDYEQRAGDRVTFGGHGVFWVDTASGTVRLTWWDSMGGSPQTFSGGWEDDRLVLEAASPVGRSRSVWWLTAEGCEHTMEMDTDGQGYRVVMTGRYVRVADPES